MSGDMTEDQLAMDARVEASYERTEPQTAAGRRLLETMQEIREDYYPLDDYPDDVAILAIEAEARAEVYALLPLERETARAAALDMARAAVAGMDEIEYWHRPEDRSTLVPLLIKPDVLAAIDALREDAHTPST